MQTRLHKVEAYVGDTLEAAKVRRNLVSETLPNAASVQQIPVSKDEFDDRGFYAQVYGAHCENVVGFLPLPIGVIGPLHVNDEQFYVPMATTEGALIASVNRGAMAIQKAGGAFATVTRDGMTRSPVVELDSARAATDFAKRLEEPSTFKKLQAVFDTTTAHGKLQALSCTVAGRYVYIRFKASTGDAMGMNMVGKGVDAIMQEILTWQKSIQLVSLSSNMCTDKKPSAMNWINGRGKSVVCDVTIPETVVKRVLRTTIEEMVQLNTVKNLVGSSLAGSIGGNNAHASNIVTAMFLATGQDPAQNVESSNCLLMMEKLENPSRLYVSVTMPSIEVGTIGGGTNLAVQKACLAMLGAKPERDDVPGEKAKKLACIVAATVLAGELSLNAALCTNDLIAAHMKLNRATTSTSS